MVLNNGPQARIRDFKARKDASWDALWAAALEQSNVEMLLENVKEHAKIMLDTSWRDRFTEFSKLFVSTTGFQRGQRAQGGDPLRFQGGAGGRLPSRSSRDPGER